MPLRVDLNQSAAQTALGRRYGYDELDRVTSINRGENADNSTRSYTYDALGRLAAWQDEHYYETVSHEVICPDENDFTTCYHPIIGQTDIVREGTFTYDSVGNRRDQAAVIDVGNRLTSFDGFALTYDADGNVLTKQKTGFSQSLTWNALGQLTNVVTNGKQVTFYYDGFGRRVRKDAQISTNSQAVQTTNYVYDGDQIVLDLNWEGALLREYTYYPGIDSPNSVRNAIDGSMYYYVSERPGHITGLVNSSNQVVNGYEYGPFGEIISASEQIAQPFRYTGREYDSETGFYYYRSRYYDPQLARFVSEDPIGLDGGINPYAYVDNDPVNFIDPSGTCRVGQVETVELVKVYIPEVGIVEIPIRVCVTLLAPSTTTGQRPRIPPVLIVGGSLSGQYTLAQARTDAGDATLRYLRASEYAIVYSAGQHLLSRPQCSDAGVVALRLLEGNRIYHTDVFHRLDDDRVSIYGYSFLGSDGIPGIAMNTYGLFSAEHGKQGTAASHLAHEASHTWFGGNEAATTAYGNACL